MVAIGPYEFTEQDVDRTLHQWSGFFTQLSTGLGPATEAVIRPFRDEAESAVRDVAPTEPVAALGILWNAWRSAMDAVRATGAFGPPASGAVTGLFRGDGGVPKLPVDSVLVGYGGVVGDRQADRANHGQPWQALCLWSTESVDQLRLEGHPIAPGLAGENVSITGLDWGRVRPGVLLRVGDVLAEISTFTTPCSKNAAWFIDGRFDVMHHAKGPHSRVYATVLEPGGVTMGAPVLLAPPR
ncbi:MAG: MOSC domain-containing protein [Aquihabitans sp.]